MIEITQQKKAYWIEGQISSPPTFEYGRLIEKKHPTFRCSLCRSTFVGIKDGFRYCPDCGARMDLKEADHEKAEP
jgi:rRNA maturation endonuclease Nob1